MPKQIATHLSTHTVHLGTGEDQFEVTVNNLSEHFATFALDLSASGVDRQNADWYSLTPDLSAKIPAGDRANFVVNILEVPPVPGGFTGKMNLNVNVTCLELGEEDRQPVNLVVAGSGAVPPTLYLPDTEFQAAPGELIEIPLQVHNPNRNTASVRVTVRGLPNAWLTDGHERRVQIAAQSYANILFICQPPVSSEAVSKVYPFEVEVNYAKTLIVREVGTFEVLPTGHIDFTCQVAEAAAETDGEHPAAAHYTIGLENHSNVDQTVALTLTRTDIPWYERLLSVLKRRTAQPALTTRHLLQLTPAEATIKAGDAAHMALTVTPRAPWLGWRRRQQFQLRPQEQKTGVQPSSDTVAVVALPQIPFWAQCLGAATLLLGVGLWHYGRAGHRGPVNSVQFDGQANSVISASDDHTIHRWQVGRNLRDLEMLKATNKAIRVVRYRPRNNDLLAAGLENGEIQLWNFLSRQPPISFVFQRDDRVFDLEFTGDSQNLFSAHGSGNVLRWDIDNLESGQILSPQQQQSFDFAIQATALVGPAEDTLALGGRFNQLMLWNFEEDRQIAIDYPVGDSNHYIFSLDVADEDATQLATSDNQGRILLWDLGRCLDGQVPCRPSDQWDDGHHGKAVNAISLTKDACYLASGGDDGRVMLWDLNPAGQVMRERQLANFRQPINSVDVVQRGHTLLVVSGGNSHRVRLHHARANNTACP
ncbi:MAG: WD40 repeat domain-containing protein [Cyanobacteria bacterium J06648_16]